MQDGLDHLSDILDLIWHILSRNIDSAFNV